MSIFLSVISIIGQIILWVLFVALVLSIVKWKVNVGYFDKKIYFALYLANWKVFSFHKNIKDEKKVGKEEINFEVAMGKINDYTQLFKEKKNALKRALEYSKETINLRSYSVFVDIGVGNAALTGIVCGAANALLSLVCGFIGNNLNIDEKCETMVNPRYNKFVFDIGGNVVISFRVIKAMWLLCKLKQLKLIGEHQHE